MSQLKYCSFVLTNIRVHLSNQRFYCTLNVLHRSAVQCTAMCMCTVQEVKSSSTVFLLAGYETTGNALAFFSQQIARNARVQQKLHDEILNTFADDVRSLHFEH